MSLTNRLSYRGLCIGSLLFLLWKAQFGVDLTDESYAAVSAWKNLALGDSPIVTEVFNAPRHFALLNYYLIRPWLPYSILAIRVSVILFWALLLFWFASLVHRRAKQSLGLLAGVCFALALLYDSALVVSWSYNWWVRIGWLFSLCCLIQSSDSAKQKSWGFAAGLGAALATIAYNTLFPLGFLVAFSLFLSKKTQRIGVWFLIGLCLPLLGDLVYLRQPHIWPHFKNAWQDITTLRDYSRQSPMEKGLGILRWITDTTEFWWVLIVYLGLSPRSPKALKILVTLAGIGVFLKRAPLMYLDHDLMRCFVGSGYAFGILLIAHPKTEPMIKRVAAITLVGGFLMALSSGVSVGSSYWLIPFCLAPFTATLVKWKNPTEKLRTSFLAVLLLTMLVGAVRRQFLRTYYDVSPSQATVTMTTAPFTGLRTNPGRKASIEKLDQILANKDFALIYPFVPGAFLLGNVRSSINTTTVQPGASPQRRLNSLRWMQSENRYPEVIVELSQHAWNWGIEGEFPYQLESDDLWVRYRKCTASTLVFENANFSAYDVDAEKAKSCATQLQVQTPEETPIENSEVL